MAFIQVSSGPAGALDNAAYLFEMIVTDMHWMSIEVATFCIAAQFSAAPGGRWGLRSARHLVSDDTRVMRLALRYGAEIGLSTSLRNRLDALYSELSDLKKRTAPLVETDSPAASQRELLQRLVPAWRKMANLAAEGLTAVEPLVRERLNPNFAEDTGSIRAFLRRAAAGETADIDRFGAVQAPRLKQRRQSPRVAVDIACRVASAQGEFAANVVDVSREGLGLVCDGPIVEREKVAALLADGRRLEGVVVRRQGRQMGITLSQRLSFTDPLFRGG